MSELPYYQGRITYVETDHGAFYPEIDAETDEELGMVKDVVVEFQNGSEGLDKAIGSVPADCMLEEMDSVDVKVIDDDDEYYSEDGEDIEITIEYFDDRDDEAGVFRWQVDENGNYPDLDEDDDSYPDTYDEIDGDDEFDEDDYRFNLITIAGHVCKSCPLQKKCDHHEDYTKSKGNGKRFLKK